MDIYQEMVNAGVDIDHHGSDMYVPVTEVTTEIIGRYPYKQSVKQFISNPDTGTQWYDVPLAYTPHFSKAAMQDLCRRSFEGHDVPEDLKEIAEKICIKYSIKGICDPMYIANTIANTIGRGDGQGNFKDGITDTARIREAARRLIGSYGCNIPKDHALDVTVLIGKILIGHTQ